MKTKHTPGPWRIGEVHVDDSNGHRVAAVTYREDQAANARLIAAAPELLEALSVLAETADQCEGPNISSALTLARAAIAKAKGQQ